MRFFIRLVAFTVIAILAGFVLFLITLPGVGNLTAPPRADAIVVLTGGGGSRISAAAALLAKGRGKRLLISGVNDTVRPADIQDLFHLDAATMRCCIDLDYRARNTLGNAGEIATWALAHHYRQLIVVTSTYHMPRVLIALHAAMPDAELTPFAVRPPLHKGLGNERRMFVEYLKYIVILGRDKLRRAGAGGKG